jgi:hypothetical protein
MKFNLFDVLSRRDNYETVLNRIDYLERRVMRLEEENIENVDLIRENIYFAEAIDKRIDIIAQEFGKNSHV